jgi:hypothetical protein
MSCCCENILDLGCAKACGLLKINAVAPSDATYQLRSKTPYQQAIDLDLLAGEFLHFPIRDFNPNALHDFELYQDGVRVYFEDDEENIFDCLRLRTIIDGAPAQETAALQII